MSMLKSKRIQFYLFFFFAVIIVVFAALGMDHPQSIAAMRP